MVNVFNIERFATHDGPGIRTTVFLKGCPLHCPWCANPESWETRPVLLYDRKKCIGCRKCEAVCPSGAINFKGSFSYDTDKCIRCRKCAANCLQNAVTFMGEEMEIEDIACEVLKDKEYYDNSKGGVTISGGEPFVQFEQMMRLINKLRDKELHIAVETTGNYGLELIKKAEPYIDMFLFDIKHLDKKRLAEVTGGNLDTILKNLRYLSEKCPKKVIVRVPVIPGFNCKKEVIEQIIDYAASLKLHEVNLLPYHNLGKNKWEQMQKEYEFGELKMLDKKELECYVEYGESRNIYVKIGG